MAHNTVQQQMGSHRAASGCGETDDEPCPLMEAPWVILTHVAAVAVSLLLGPLQLILPKGTWMHRMMGRIWSGAMVIACLSALLILDRPMPPNFGPFSLAGLALCLFGGAAPRAE